MRFKASTIFVTGGAGFIGSAVVRHLLRNTHARVINIDKFTYAANLDSLPGTNENLNYAFEKQCICDSPGLRHLFEEIPARRGDEPRRRKPCRSIDRRARRIHPNQHRRYLHPFAGNVALLARAIAREAKEIPFPSRLDR